MKILIKLAISLIIVFNLSGCFTFKLKENSRWLMPEKPKSLKVNSWVLKKDAIFIPKANGLFLDNVSSSNLVYNIDELDRYIEKLELLIKEMEKYYEN